MAEKIIPPIPCSHCGEPFTARNRQQLWKSRRGYHCYCKPECRRAGKSIAMTKLTLSERFLAHVTIHPNGCLHHDGSTENGYPRIMVNGKLKLASHVAWFLHYGEWPPPELKIDHICHDPDTCDGGVNDPHRRCAEWSHMKLVTQKENCSPERSRLGRVTRARRLAGVAN